ncbi:MAG: FGGY family carbohydrate kinase [Bacteroidota bacterium]
MEQNSLLVLGLDVGTSFVKASVMNEAGAYVGSVSVPEKEMAIEVATAGWAEQEPEMWWDNVVEAVRKLKSKVSFQSSQIKAIGITYQMHGLVLVDKDQEVLRPSIIWCDSRAVHIGDQAFRDLGTDKCLNDFLNSPGNFTASKLKWVFDNEPEVAEKIHKAMLPGDFIAMKMTGEINTTVSGLSEGILWDFKRNNIATELLEYFKIDSNILPDLVPTFGVQGHLSGLSADDLGLSKGTPITYRAGDQPNNAFSLNVLQPGEIAATAGTSGVIYGVGDQPVTDQHSRVNTFAHVNHGEEEIRLGTLLCINGTGIMNSWLRKTYSSGDILTYEKMNKMAKSVEAGSEGLQIYPFGNGAERILKNRAIGAWMEGINFNIHSEAHIFRAAQEGIVFALNYGLQIMRDMQVNAKVVRAGEANMFLSPVFREVFVNTTGCVLELYNTDGSLGAARAAAVGLGIFNSIEESFRDFHYESCYEPDPQLMKRYNDLYESWLESLNKKLI